MRRIWVGGLKDKKNKGKKKHISTNKFLNMTPEKILVPKGLYFLNVGKPNAKKRANHNAGTQFHTLRRWDNSRKFGFVSAGQGVNWSKQIKKLNIGDIVCAYVTEKGFVGIGECMSTAVKILDFKTLEGEFLDEKKLNQETHVLTLNASNKPKSEYAVQIKWLEGLTVDLKNAHRVVGQKLGITQHIVSDLKDSEKKVKFIEEKFGVYFSWSGRKF